MVLDESVERARLAAVKKAVEMVKKEGPEVLGVGTGSTTALFIKEAHRTGVLEGKVLVPSSIDTMLRLANLGYAVIDPGSVDAVDMYVDSADLVDKSGNVIVKGGGGALTTEKVVMASSKMAIIVVDYRKVVDEVGAGVAVPVDVLPKAIRFVLRRLRELGFDASPREAEKKKGPVVSDVGGVIVDAVIGEGMTPEEAAYVISSVPGVIEHGLFIRMADTVLVGLASGSVKELPGMRVCPRRG